MGFAEIHSRGWHREGNAAPHQGGLVHPREDLQTGIHTSVDVIVTLHFPFSLLFLPFSLVSPARKEGVLSVVHSSLDTVQ